MGAGRGPTGLKTGWNRHIGFGEGGLAGISPFMLGWTLGMLTGYSANLVRAGSHADTGKVGLDGRVREKISWG